MDQREKEALLTRLRRMERYEVSEAQYVEQASKASGDTDAFLRGLRTANVINIQSLKGLISFVETLDPANADEYLKLIATAEADEKRAAKKAAQAEASAYKHETKAKKKR